MKGVEVVEVPARPVMHIPFKGELPIKGWGLRYVSGIDNERVQPGDWMTRWDSTAMGSTFEFGADLTYVFWGEAYARDVSEALRTNADIKTEVVKIDR
jgi:hypothetical protein